MKQTPTTFHPSQLTTQRGQLQFLVAFAQLDLDALSAGDWLNLRACLSISATASRVAGGRPGVRQPMLSLGLTGVTTKLESAEDASQLPTWSPADVRAAQADTLAGLHSLTPGLGRLLDPPPVLALSGKVSLSSSAPHVRVDAPLRMLLLWHLLWLLLAEPPDRIQQCPECETIFYRVKKQAYCSRACANRVTQRRWRERHAATSTG